MLDQLIRYVSPQMALRRQLARVQLSGVRRARMYFDGATSGHRAGGWKIVNTDGTAEARLAGARLRDVARDMCRNHAYAARGKAVIISHTVGDGIIPNIITKKKATRKLLEDLLIEHFDSTACDAAGRTDLYGLQQLVMGTVAESGECLVRLRPRRVSDGLPVPWQLQVMEPDFLDPLKDGEQPNGNFCVSGIEFNKIGQVVAYHLFDDHPGSITRRQVGLESRPVPAANIAHIFRVDRAGQARGVSWFAPVILRIRDFHDYSDAQMMRQKIAACFAGFITQDDPNVTTIDGETTETGNPLEALEPGILERLRPGEKVEFGNPPSVTGDLDPYARLTLREIASGLGLSYESLTGDLSQVNFHSGRMGWIEMQKNINTWQNRMLVPQFLGPVASWFLTAARIMGLVPSSDRATDRVAIKWTPPKRQMISPRDEIPFANQAIRAGFMTRSDWLRQNGYDPEKVEEEYAEENKRADALGLIFDSDPRNRTATGNAVTDPADAADAAGFGEAGKEAGGEKKEATQ